MPLVQLTRARIGLVSALVVIANAFIGFGLNVLGWAAAPVMTAAGGRLHREHTP